MIIYDTLTSFYITTITLKVNTGVKSVRFSPGELKYLFFIRNEKSKGNYPSFADGSNLAVGLLNGNVFLFDVLGNGDFHLRNDGMLRVSGL